MLAVGGADSAGAGGGGAQSEILRALEFLGGLRSALACNLWCVLPADFYFARRTHASTGSPPALGLPSINQLGQAYACRTCPSLIVANPVTTAALS